jgi:predicted helicase
MLKDNLGIITCRQQIKTGFDHVFVSDTIADSDTVSNRTRERGYFFPLYIYSTDGERTINFSHKFLEFIFKKYGKELSSEVTFYYIYAILHSHIYRGKYAEYLQSDFPRIPFVEDYEVFKQFSNIGKELIEMHLMKKTLPTHTNFDIEGSNIVKKVKYNDLKLWFNNDQYFEGVPNDVWNYRVGGYKVLDHWLKDRISKKLSSTEIQTFLQIIEIIKLTIIAMKKIDEIYKISL